MRKLPPGWVQASLGNVAEVRLGRQRSPKNHSGPQMRPYLRAANVDWEGLRLDDVKQMNFTDDEAVVYRLEPGDILLNEASGSPTEVGKPALWNGEIEDCCFQNTLLRVRSHHVDPKYLLYCLRYEALSGAFAGSSRGVGIHHLGAARLAAWPVPLPPLAEQRRIVAALEQQQSRMEAANASLGTALKRAHSLRQQLLSRLTRPDSDERWARRSLGEIAVGLRNGIFVSRPGTQPDGVPILRISAIRSMQLDLSEVRYSARSATSLESDGSLLKSGDVLFTRYNGNTEYVGVCAVVPKGIDPLTYPDKLIRVTLDSTQAIPEFVAMACSAGQARQAIRGYAKTTAGQAGISGRELKAVPLALPDLGEQRRRVVLFLEYDQAIRRLEAQLETALCRGRNLRASLLAEAFAGRLVPQDLNDEPVSDLLIRIRNARQVASKRRTRKAAPRQEETLL